MKRAVGSKQQGVVRTAAVRGQAPSRGAAAIQVGRRLVIETAYGPSVVRLDFIRKARNLGLLCKNIHIVKEFKHVKALWKAMRTHLLTREGILCTLLQSRFPL